jgi:type I restriction enzyme, S subunit
VNRPWLEANGNTFPYRKLIHVASLKARIGWQSLRTDEFVDEGPFCVTGTDFQHAKVNWSTAYHVSVERYEMDRNIQLAKGDLLVTKDGTIGKVAVVDELDTPATLNSGVFVVRPKTCDLATDFLGWVIRSKVFDDFVAYNFSGSTINHLYQNVFETFRFPFPDLPTQRAIADFLDRETARIDLLIEKKQRLVELLGERKTTQLENLLFGSNFELRKLRRESQVISKGTTPSTIGAEMVSDGIRFLKAENVTWGGVNTYPENFISKETHRALRRSILYDGDVLVVIAGATTGKTTVMPASLAPANTNQAVSFVRLRNLQYAKIVCAALSCPCVQRDILLTSVQSAQPNLSMHDLGNLMVPFPQEEQILKVLGQVNLINKTAINLISATESSINRLKEYRSALITAAVTGQIDVTEYAKSGTTDRRLDAIQEEMGA